MHAEIDIVAKAMVADANRRVRDFSSKMALLPIGTRVVDIDFYTAADGRERDRDCANERWCVITARWDGKRFVRAKRISGALAYEETLRHMRGRAKGLGVPLADDIRRWAEGLGECPVDLT